LNEADGVGSLGVRTAKGAGWLMGWRFASRLLGLVNTVILVRVLVPADFGLVALATSFSFAIDGLSYMGVQEALVREQALDRALYDTGFTMNVLRGLLTAVIIAAFAWPGARLFGDPRLVEIFLTLAVALFMSSLENIGTVDFQRELYFGKQVQIMLVPRLASMIVTITVALVWHSYWALVAGTLVMRGARMAFTYIIHPYRPRITLRAWRGLIGFSFWSWALSMLNVLHMRADTIVIGAYLNPAAVGLFSIGSEVGTLVTSELLDPMLRALFAGLAAARRSGGSIAAAYMQAISVFAVVVLPASAGIALITQPLMHIMFGPRWDDAIPLAQAFACLGVVRVGAYIGSTLLLVEGVPQLNVRIDGVLIVLRLGTLLVLVPILGIMGAVASAAIAGVTEEVVYIIVTFRRVGLRGRDLTANLWRPLLATAGMAIVLMRSGLTSTPTGMESRWSLLLLGASILLGATVYCAMLSAAWFISGRPRGGERYLLQLVRRMFIGGRQR
jgi:O-antigen/teichoic acid export membrane protein